MGEAATTLNISSTGLSAEISPFGAEMRDLRDADGRSLQWDGDPAVWVGRAPLLFPIVGMLAGGRYRLDGREFVMPKHGFARHSTFDVVSHEPHAVVLRLMPTAETRAAYPFEFQLDLAYTLTDATLRMVATVANRGDAPMPASFGFHPAFRWPLPYSQAREHHAIRFDHDEPAPIRRIDAGGLLLAEPQPTPVVGDSLALRDALFVDDAMIFDRLTSRALRYGAPAGPRLVIRFDGFPMLGVWTKTGSGFICIEPWQGVADPVGYAGDLWTKPGIMTIAPGQSRALEMTVELEWPDDSRTTRSCRG